LFLNKEEAALFVPTATTIVEQLHGLRDLGPTVVVITDGTNGSYVYDGGTTWSLPILPAPVVERTGCGDAYASGFLSAVMNNQVIPEAMRWGTANAASVIGRVGSQAGLLTRTEIDKMLSTHPKLQPKVE
jgi:ribokinase